VRAAREELGWSQQKLAEVLRVSLRHVVYIEQGQGCALKTAYQLAATLKIDLGPEPESARTSSAPEV